MQMNPSNGHFVSAKTCLGYSAALIEKLVLREAVYLACQLAVIGTEYHRAADRHLIALPSTGLRAVGSWISLREAAVAGLLPIVMGELLSLGVAPRRHWSKSTFRSESRHSCESNCQILSGV
jgi:hypothetical protein